MEDFGSKLATVLHEGDVVYLRGELGAGKTTLVRGAARGLGFKGKVTSPTFTLMNIYPTQPPVYHFDFYRLEDNDLTDLGLDDYLEKGGVTFIEWPSFTGELPEHALNIEIELVDDDYEKERRVLVSAAGPEYAARLKELKQIC
jgi:tRNA threonylcarbamoyladenosine biosynthesis protein TsaE